MKLAIRVNQWRIQDLQTGGEVERRPKIFLGRGYALPHFCSLATYCTSKKTLLLAANGGMAPPPPP